MSRFISILGSGRYYHSCVAHLDKTLWKQNGVWHHENNTSLFYNSIQLHSDLGLVFFDYPIYQSNEAVSVLSHNNVPYIRFWSMNALGGRSYSVPRANNIYLDDDVDWNHVFSKCKILGF